MIVFLNIFVKDVIKMIKRDLLKEIENGLKIVTDTVNEGILNIYIPLFVVIGMILYKVFYDKYIMKYFNKLIDIINKLVIDKLKLAIKNIYDIIKNKKRKWKDAKKQQSRSRKMESKQSGQYSYDWSFFNRNHGDD